MQFFVLAAFAALAAAMPAVPGYQAPAATTCTDEVAPQKTAAPYTAPAAPAEEVCPVGWSPQCCEVDVLGVAALTCSARKCRR